MALRVLELFSGMGGMHSALDLLGIDCEVVAAVDINPTANLVYAFNFPQVPIVSRSIETISLKQWDKWHADLWTMSPPCQPFTRQGKQEDLGDRRTDGFVYLMQTVLPQLQSKPRYILLENVSGFEHSQAHQLLLDTLQAAHYSYEQYLLSPIQFGIPNSRLRYYLIATLHDTPIEMPPPVIHTRIASFHRLLLKLREQFPSKDASSSSSSTDQSERYCNDQITEQCSHSSEILVEPEQSMTINEFLVSNENTNFELDEKQRTRGLHVSDVITHQAKRSHCFTKSYGKYFEGTGSLFRTATDRIRYFTPKEIANLHCFPASYQFPEQTTVRQAYSLLGNSLNVFVIAVLLAKLFERC